MNMKSALTSVMLILTLAARAQTSHGSTNLVPVTILVTESNAALVADFQSNGVPIDTVITLGAKAALNQARGRLLDLVNHSSYDELATAYPRLVPILDSDAPASIQEQQLRALVSMQLSKVRTSGDATQVFTLLQAAQDSVRRKQSNPGSISTNLPPAH
jgi:hypothetical protein